MIPTREPAPVRPVGVFAESRRLRLVAATVAGVLGGVPLALADAEPAAAHVVVAADHPVAGGRNVTIRFTADADGASTGLTAVRVLLPDGLGPRDVRPAGAPAGWTFTAERDGYQVSGPALAAGQAAVHAVTVAELPRNTDRLAFRTVTTFSNGATARWVDLPLPDRPEPANPAPVLLLRSASSSASVRATPAGTPPAADNPAAPLAVPRAAGHGLLPAAKAALWAIAGLAVLLAVGLAGLVARMSRRRRGTVDTPGSR